jgi:Pyruvate/2-oxoacid:ferredoxin oxidoreductase delta subunit
MTVKRKIIEIDEDLCDGCGTCVPSCAEGALQMVDGKARLIGELYCDGLGACLGDCPTGALTIVEREAEEFDEEAVEQLLKKRDASGGEKATASGGGCPSAQIQTFVQETTCQRANMPVTHRESDSSLSHWPIQVRLVPPHAPFLKGADLLVAADCTPVAYPHFHRDFLEGKAVMIGCPKFDDKNEYIQKFADIFQEANIHSVAVVVMEVPCCSALPIMVKQGMERAGKKIPMEEIVISAQGDILKREKQAA